MDSIEFKTAYYTKLASAAPHLTQEEYVDIHKILGAETHYRSLMGGSAPFAF